MTAMVMLSFNNAVCKRRKKYYQSCAHMQYIDGMGTPEIHTEVTTA